MRALERNGLGMLLYHSPEEHSKMRIYVGNIPYQVTDTELGDHFKKFGEVAESVIIADKNQDPPRSKGFGFINMPDEESGKMAVKELDGAEFRGRTLTVREANPRKDASSNYKAHIRRNYEVIETLG